MGRWPVIRKSHGGVTVVTLCRASRSRDRLPRRLIHLPAGHRRRRPSAELFGVPALPEREGEAGGGIDQGAGSRPHRRACDGAASRQVRAGHRRIHPAPRRAAYSCVHPGLTVPGCDACQAGDISECLENRRPSPRTGGRQAARPASARSRRPGRAWARGGLQHTAPSSRSPPPRPGHPHQPHQPDGSGGKRRPFTSVIQWCSPPLTGTPCPLVHTGVRRGRRRRRQGVLGCSGGDRGEEP